MKKSIRIEVRDFAMFLKHNLDGLLEQSDTTDMLELGKLFNTVIQTISNGRYGYFWDDNERWDEYYLKPSSKVAINATRTIFGLRNCENILTLPVAPLGWWLEELEDFKSPRANSLRRDRWRNRGKALKSVPMWYRDSNVIWL